MLDLTKTTHCRLVAGINHEMKTAESLDGDDRTMADGIRGAAPGVRVGRQAGAVSMPQGQRWTALWAGIGLGVKTPVLRVVVFGLAQLTHVEMSHGGVWPIVRQRFDNAETGAAVGTVDKGIQITAVVWIEQLASAICTGGDIRQHNGRFRRAKVSPKPWNWEKSHEIGCGYPVGASQGDSSPTRLTLSPQVGRELHVQAQQWEYEAGVNEDTGCVIEPRNAYCGGQQDIPRSVARGKPTVSKSRKATVLGTLWRVCGTPPGSKSGACCWGLIKTDTLIRVIR